MAASLLTGKASQSEVCRKIQLITEQFKLKRHDRTSEFDSFFKAHNIWLQEIPTETKKTFHS